MKAIPLNKMRRDGVFKALHQKLAPSNFYALDGDLILVDKIPPKTAYVVAHLEFKMDREPISFTQAIYFNQLVSAPMPWRVPVYIIRARNPYDMPPTDITYLSHEYCEHALETHRFDVMEYLHADWGPEPPRVNYTIVAENIGWRELIKWEQELRKSRNAELAPYIKAGWQLQHATHNTYNQEKTNPPPISTIFWMTLQSAQSAQSAQRACLLCAAPNRLGVKHSPDAQPPSAARRARPAPARTAPRARARR